MSFTELASKKLRSGQKAASEHRLKSGQEEDALQPHQAYEKLLRDWVPFLRDELNTCVNFLMLREEASSSALPQGSVMSLTGRLRKASSPIGCKYVYIPSICSAKGDAHFILAFEGIERSQYIEAMAKSATCTYRMAAKALRAGSYVSC